MKLFYYLYIVLLSLTGIFPTCAQHTKKLPNPFFVYDFHLQKQSVPKRIELLQNIGFEGIVYSVKINDASTLKQIDAYTEAIKAAAKPFQTFAVYFFVEPYKPINDSIVQACFQKIKAANAVPWVIFLGDKNESDRAADEATVMRVLTKMTDEAAKNKMDLVMYPHDNSLVESVEESILFIRKVNKKNLKTSLHLCHELRAGNDKRMEEVIKNAYPYVSLVSLSGSDSVVYKHRRDWSDCIQPLENSQYDVASFVKLLAKYKYTCPIALHTFGLKENFPAHIERSFAIWQQMSTRISSQK